MKRKILSTLLLLFSLSTLLCSCILEMPEHKHNHNITVHSYVVHNPGSTNPKDLQYWYIVMAKDHSYYYSTTTSPISDFIEVNFTKASGNPETRLGSDVTKLDPQEVNASELSENIQTEATEITEAQPKDDTIAQLQDTSGDSEQDTTK